MMFITILFVLEFHVRSFSVSELLMIYTLLLYWENTEGNTSYRKQAGY